MAGRLIAQGTSAEGFRQAVASTSGDGLTIIELDFRHVIPVPDPLPDIPVGEGIRHSLPAIDVSLRAIPGVHLERPSTYTADEARNVGTVRVFITTNPLPLIPISVAVILLGLGAVIAWRIYKATPAEFAVILVIIVLGALLAAVLFLRPQAIGTIFRGGS